MLPSLGIRVEKRAIEATARWARLPVPPSAISCVVPTARYLGLAPSGDDTDEELAERARDYAAWLAAPDHPRLGAFE